MSRIERATRDPQGLGGRGRGDVRASRLPAKLATSTRFAEAVTGEGARVLYRLTASALAQADQLRAAGRTPQPTSWSGDYSGDRTRDNPRGLPTITVTAVR